MRRRLAAYRLTAAGGALLFILAAALIVLLLGPSHDEGPAFIVIAIVLAMLVVNGMPTGRLGQLPFESSLSERRERFHPGDRDAAGAVDPPEEEEAWRQERERYADRERHPD